MLNAAVIGIGSMGKNHARNYHELEGVNLAAVADSNQKRGKKVAQKYHCKYYSDYRQMIRNENIDLVSVVVPTSLHTRVAVDCLNRKINCLIEKPIADSLEQGRKIIRAAKKNRVKLMVGHIERFNPAVVELKRRLDKNELGRVFKFDVNRVGPFPPRIRDAGVIVDLATHDIDVMRYVTGSEVSRLFAETKLKIHTKHEDLLSALVKFGNGALCNLNINRVTPTKIRKLYITGERGMFVVNYLTQDLYFYENEEIKNNFDYADIMRGVSEGKMIKYFVKKKEPLQQELSHFIDCVKNNRKPLVTGKDGLKALMIATKLKESGKKGKVMRL